MNIAEIFRQIAFEHHQVVHDQRRKYTGMPYVVHTKEVADIYAFYFPEDLIGQAAGFGHDLLEDTKATIPALYNQIRELAPDIAPGHIIGTLHMIQDLTDEYTSEKYPKIKRAERKKLERERLKHVAGDSQNVKLCDLISNTASIVEHDENFARVYLDEKWELLKVLTRADGSLLSRATRQCYEAKLKLGCKNLL